MFFTELSFRWLSPLLFCWKTCVRWRGCLRLFVLRRDGTVRGFESAAGTRDERTQSFCRVVVKNLPAIKERIPKSGARNRTSPHGHDAYTHTMQINSHDQTAKHK